MFFDQMEIIFFTFGSKKMGDPARGLTKRLWPLVSKEKLYFLSEKETVF